ncbi:MAG TPA: undecaprenyldiphospho-muramoylpentapeptide beta-N-acetylglucosaminyltransferase [Polyangiaceae bacterium]|nr:undecaprenyldiphospho-muramoylpentapeptide beta-N-acetylglucosaminyltransferase [Polyangiaceae bacterium]
MTALLFAGGGTGGHVFPMIAVADAVRALRPDVELVFAGTERGLEVKLVPARGFALTTLRIAPLRGGGVRGAARGTYLAARAVAEARQLVRRVSPAAVLSIGGYAAGPVALAAWSLGVPVALVEPNAAIGIANRLAAPFVRRAYVAFPEARKHFRRGAALLTGVPLRGGFASSDHHPGRVLSVLVLGGSQGAESLNRTVPEALSRVDVNVVHQCGAGRDAAVRALYAELGLGARARVEAFIDDMPAALSKADVVIGRAGASAVAEICAVGRASVLIPYPFAGDHQRHNAESLERAGAAVCIRTKDATRDRLTAVLRRMDRDRAALAAMAAAARALGRPEAATVIAEDLLALAGIAREGSRSPPSAPSGDSGRGGGGRTARAGSDALSGGLR